ncbi:hypothetical protein GF340_00980 [Candidatus Peregrinibacteria bacterium]|nr:hypothetical protein [Candidatus Peregrinibacteria bacterium]
MSLDVLTDLPDDEVAGVLEYVEFMNNLSLVRLNDINSENVPERDRPFIENLKYMAEVDPEIVHRMAVINHKLKGSLRITQQEATEMLEVLKRKGFYQTGLDLSGMTFTTLDLSEGVIGHTLDLRFTTMRGICNLKHSIVYGFYLDEGMRRNNKLYFIGGQKEIQRTQSIKPASFSIPVTFDDEENEPMEEQGSEDRKTLGYGEEERMTTPGIPLPAKYSRPPKRPSMPPRQVTLPKPSKVPTLDSSLLHPLNESNQPGLIRKAPPKPPRPPRPVRQTARRSKSMPPKINRISHWPGPDTSKIDDSWE